MPVHVSADTSMMHFVIEVLIFHTPRMKVSRLSHIGVNTFTQNYTPWFDMCLDGILLNSYVNSTGLKPRDGVRLGHLASDQSRYRHLRFCVAQIDHRR
jgi:hypothetical protein